MTLPSLRRFQLWEYRVSHGSLLIRSPRSPEVDTNIDLIFDGVEYVACARMLHGLELLKGETSDSAQVEEMFGAVRAPDQIFVLKSEGRKFFVVASSYRVEENTDDIFASPFVI